jgi:hypothetical protein
MDQPRSVGRIIDSMALEVKALALLTSVDRPNYKSAIGDGSMGRQWREAWRRK